MRRLLREARGLACRARRWRRAAVALALAGSVSAGAATDAKLSDWVWPGGVVPEWIWYPADGAEATNAAECFLRTTFQTPPYTWNARLTVSADDAAEVYLNGRLVANCDRWDRPVRSEVTVHLNQGENVLGIRARNREGPAGVLAHLNLGGQGGAVVASSSRWLCSLKEEPGWSTTAFRPAGWLPARSLGPHGLAPWGEVFFRPVATAAESIQVPPGFRVELLRSAEPGEGSWICLAFDDRGRLYVSAEDSGLRLLRFEFDARGHIERFGPVPAPLGQAMGLHYAFGSLYVNGNGPQGTGLYRLTDANHNGEFEAEEARLLKRFSVGGEHGYHAIASSPDGQLWVLNGNMTRPPEGLADTSPYRHAAEDVVSLNPDELGPAASGIKPPAGYIVRTDPDGQHWELVLGGLRNAYGFDFNADGELFTFDSDNEWNWGTCWYVPTRILHCVSGADYGWRDALRIWPDDLPDTLPPVLNVGIGSPTGVRSATRSGFPAPWRDALLVQDWSYGRILAVYLKPQGASYRAAWEPFLQGRPLNLTAMEFGPDGALYFATGGRATQSGLYRVRYEGPAAAGPAAARSGPSDAAAVQARALRRRLESFHGREHPDALATAWAQLGSADPFLRHAARVALESQPLAAWRDRVLAETNAAVALPGLLALARVEDAATAEPVLRALRPFAWERLTHDQRALWLRVLSVSLARRGRPPADLAAEFASALSPHYPGTNAPLNRELCRLLLYLGAPDAVPKSVGLLEAAALPEEQFHYVAQLRHARVGWSLDDRRRYFAWWLKPRSPDRHPAEILRWFGDVGRSYVDGASVDRYLNELHRDAVAELTDAERAALADVLTRPIAAAVLLPANSRQLVREWALEDILPHLERAVAGRDFARARQAWIDVQCLACHRLGNEGGAIGPELTGVGSKYTRRDILESMLDPSKVVSEQFRNVTVVLKDGDDVTGRLISETDEAVVVETDWRRGTRRRVERGEVESVQPSAISPMPEGLLNVLALDEILDLIAFLEAGGREDAPAFRATGK